MEENKVNIPNDVIANEIFTRLPAKCLGRCKCVSKSWHNHIENPKFVQFHHDFMVKDESNLSLILTCGTSLYILHNFLGDVSSSRRHLAPLTLPAFARNTGVKVVGSHNGLLCIGSGKTLNNYFVMNPNMPRNPKILPFAQNVFSRTFGGRSLDYLQNRCLMTPGFGYDHITGIYKLVYIFILTDDRDPQPEGMVYNSRTGSWTRLEPPIYVAPPISIDKWIFCGELNNSLHFAGQRDKNVVITFDLHDETWGEINLPCCKLGYEVEKEVYELEEGYEVEEVYEIIDAFVLKGCLSALIIDHGCKFPTFWVWKNYGDENSWIKLFTLQIFRVSRVLYYRSNSPLVLLLHEGYGVIWLDYVKGLVEVIKGENGALVSDCSVVFTESLALVPGVRSRHELLEMRKSDEVKRRQQQQRQQRGEIEVEIDVLGKSIGGSSEDSDDVEIKRLRDRDTKKKERAEKKKMKKIEKLEKKKKKIYKMKKVIKSTSNEVKCGA